MKDLTLEQKYLINPFTKEINSKGFPTSTNEFKLIVGTTGLGKTYSSFNSMIPTLFEDHNLDLVIYSYPMTEVFSRSDALMVISNTKGVVFAENLDDALDTLRYGYKVFLCVTHHLLSPNSKNGDYFLNEIVSNNYKSGWWVDEPHTWLACSDKVHYTDTIGSYNAAYGATLYKQVSKISKMSPYTFGTTATPTAEHTHLLEPVGDMKFKVLNDYPTTDEMISRCGWVGQTHMYELGSLPDDKQTIYTFRQFLDNVCYINNTYGKRVGMINVEPVNGSGGFNIDNVVKLLQAYFENDDDYIDERICVLSSDFTGYINFKKINGVFHTIYEDEKEVTVIRNLNNPSHPSTYVITIEKGKMGMNVHCLKSFFSFRKTDKKRSSKFGNESITDSPLQRLGRMMRIWTGQLTTDFVSNWGYDLTGYVQSLNTTEKESLLELNSFDIYVPDNDMWSNTINDVLNLVPTKTSASSWMKNKEIK